MSDQIENRIIEAKSRGIYEAPGMRCCGSPTSASSTRSTTRTRSPTTTSRGAAWAVCSTKGRWLDPQALMMRESIQRWIASGRHRRGHVRPAPRRDYTIINTAGPAFSYQPERLSMERTESAAFGPSDRIGQLTMRNLDIADTRDKLSHAQQQPVNGAGCSSSTASSWAPSPGGRDQIIEGSGQRRPSRSDPSSSSTEPWATTDPRAGTTPIGLARVVVVAHVVASGVDR